MIPKISSPTFVAITPGTAAPRPSAEASATLGPADVFNASPPSAPPAVDALRVTLRSAGTVNAQVTASLVAGPTAPAIGDAVRVSAPDAAQKAVAKHSQTFTTGRGYATYIKLLDGRVAGEANGPFGAAMEALRGKAGARWLDSGGGEGFATLQLKEAAGYENLHATVLSYESSAQPAPGYDVMTGRFIEDIPSAELGKNDVITDVYGPLAYSGKPAEVLRKYVDALKPDGQIFAFLGAALEHYGEKNKIATADGRVLPFGEWLQTIPGLQVDLEKRPIVDDEGQQVTEAWIACIRRDPTHEVAIPTLEPLWFQDGNPKEFFLVPRQVLAEAGAHGPSPERREALRTEATQALRARAEGKRTEQFFEAFRIGEFRNPLMGELSSLEPGDEWVNVGPMADTVGRSLADEHEIAFDDPDYLGFSQWIMEQRAERVHHRGFTYTPSADAAELHDGRGARLITDCNGTMLSSYAPDETLKRYLGALRDGGEAFLYMGLEKGGTGIETRVVTKDGHKVDLRGWLASVPGLEVDKYRGGTWHGGHFQQHLDENVFVRLRVDDAAAVRVPRLELMGTGGTSGDGVPVPMFREVD